MESVRLLGGLLSVLAKDRDAAIARTGDHPDQLRYSRVDEDDADGTAMDLMWNAGFDPKGALGVTQVFRRDGER